ncbi:MAG: hypothetical protein CR982_08495 [Candidatus Cloacimonadota bacterium]|nr:MAG: hypothetical protein CR982_08495 [Candidatus Cloacimonadota bacterium]PIE78673.1 MAG: hypothetical protein CSA15_06420 [Candidatus Delongbacteria bacterium]
MKRLIFIILISFFSSYGNDSGLIYGKVTTVDGETFEGNIRWGKEEVMWMDHFNATKTDNEFEDFEPRNKKERKRKKGWKFTVGGFKVSKFYSGSSSSYFFNQSHSFAVMFGDIKRLDIEGNDEVKVTMRSGKVYNFEGGSNDIGTSVKVYDREIGEVKIKWDRIENVLFEKSSSSMKKKFGKPLYGEVETDAGKFEGYIIWDKDERLSTDKLDGKNRNGDLSIEFESIKSIERDGRGVNLVLKSGREFYLKGTNDVNSGNRGIVVNIPDMGRITCDWREFKKVTFKEDPNRLPVYNDFDDAKRIKGLVKLKDGNSYKGILAYDLDETWTYEMIDGEKDYIEYSIPIRFIKSIKPKNFNYSMVILKNGKKIKLGDGRDVSDDNGGILIIEDMKNKDAVLVDWNDIEEILFK